MKDVAISLQVSLPSAFKLQVKRLHMRKSFVGSVVLALLALLQAAAQHPPHTAAANASISGVVVDFTGTVIPGARVTAIEESSGAFSQTTTDATGIYRLSDLPAGRYRITFQASGFKNQTQSAVEASPARIATLNVHLAAGQERVVVCSGRPIETTVPSPSHPEFALHISADGNVAAAGSELQLTVVLTNTTNHKISIPHDTRPNRPAFPYQVRVADVCGNEVSVTQVGDKPDENTYKFPLAPGETLTDRIELSKVMKLTDTGDFVVQVLRPDALDQPPVESNPLNLTVAPPPKGEGRQANPKASAGSPGDAITGTVSDAAGAFISGVRVTAAEETIGALFETTTDANGHYRLANLPAGSYRVRYDTQGLWPQTRSEIETSPPHATRLDISFPSPQEVAISCSCSIGDEALEKYLRDSSPPDPVIALHISVNSSRVANGADVWLTVTLTNISDHPILIPTEKGSGGPAFAYGIGAADLCNCPISGANVGYVSQSEAKAVDEGKQPVEGGAETVVRLPPGGTLTDRVELRKLLKLTDPRTYVIRAARSPALETNAQTRNQLWNYSNRINVIVEPPGATESGAKSQ
jgi:hypothetical protein